ncbi:MAG: trypsin-like serine peptidase [Solirubrobacterales bacterium]
MGRRIGLSALCSLLATSALAAPALASDVAVKQRKAEKSNVADYWTANRIAAARPLEATREDDGKITVRGVAKDPFGVEAPFTSGPVADSGLPPNTVNGKLYGKIRGVGPYECSATSVDAPNRNLIFSAGHCVAEPGGSIASKIVFIPSYEEQNRPFGTWVFERIVVLKAWKRNSNFNFDYSAVEVSPQNGVNLEDAVGGAPLALNLPVEQTYTSVGYPSNIEEGQIMWNCVGPFAGRDPRPIPNGPLPIAMGCDMGPGASGGGWFVNGALNSVTSFGYKDIPDVGYGPYFGGKTGLVYNKAAN